MNTDTRTTAIVLDALAKLDPKNSLAPNTVRWLMSARKADRWETTQENAWAIMALTDWMAATGELKGNYDWQVALNDAAAGRGHRDAATRWPGVATLHADISATAAGPDQRAGDRPRAQAGGQTGDGSSTTRRTSRPTSRSRRSSRSTAGFAVSAANTAWPTAGNRRSAEARTLPAVTQAKVGDVLQVKVTVVVPNTSLLRDRGRPAAGGHGGGGHRA